MWNLSKFGGNNVDDTEKLYCVTSGKLTNYLSFKEFQWVPITWFAVQTVLLICYSSLPSLFWHHQMQFICLFSVLSWRIYTGMCGNEEWMHNCHPVPTLFNHYHRHLDLLPNLRNGLLPTKILYNKLHIHAIHFPQSLQLKNLIWPKEL